VTRLIANVAKDGATNDRMTATAMKSAGVRLFIMEMVECGSWIG
jgi:hypothetical protein